MNDGIKVQAMTGNTTRFQWAKKLLYRQDAQKVTMVPKKLWWLLGGFFGIAAFLLMVQGLGESPPVTAHALVGTVSAAEVVALPTNEQATATAATSRANASGGKRAAKFNGPQLVLRPLMKIPPGTFAKARLVSGASNGPVRAEVSEALNWNGEPLLPAGTILVGTGSSTEDRLNIQFTQLVFPDGSFQTTQANACDDADKIPGLKGSKLGNYALKLGAGTALAFAGGLSQGLQTQHSGIGVSYAKPTLKNALLNGAATASLDQSKQIMTNLQNQAPVIEVPEGTPIYVLFQGQ
jgi:type IV secretory pathway VirB10-like protein